MLADSMVGKVAECAGMSRKQHILLKAHTKEANLCCVRYDACCCGSSSVHRQRLLLSEMTSLLHGSQPSYNVLSCDTDVYMAI